MERSAGGDWSSSAVLVTFENVTKGTYIWDGLTGTGLRTDWTRPTCEEPLRLAVRSFNAVIL